MARLGPGWGRLGRSVNQLEAFDGAGDLLVERGALAFDGVGVVDDER